MYRRAKFKYHSLNIVRDMPIIVQINKIDKPYKRLQSQDQVHMKNGLPL